MAHGHDVEVPETLEGWYILHDVYAVDWAAWRVLDSGERDEIAAAASQWIAEAGQCEQGDSALYSIVTQKGDLMLLHYRPSPEALNQMEFSFRQNPLFDFLVPTYSYLSVIEIGLYELTAMARKKLADRGLEAGSADYQAAFDKEMAGQKERVKGRLFRNVPDNRYVCIYPMNKRRGEQINWYSLSMEQRRDMMRGHGRIGHKYHDRVTQIIGGSVGLDDWEWFVSLHADDALVFKKLVYEMRFDPASALYAEFGPFTIGIRQRPEALPAILAGRLPASDSSE
jgi:chlorite dismutase